MSLVFDGIIIPENKANALIFNGTDIDNVYMDGVQVWKHNLFSAIWSGSSIVASWFSLYTSGSLFRLNSGAWLTAYSNGTFSNGVSSNKYGPTQTPVYYYLYGYGNNLLRYRIKNTYAVWGRATAWCHRCHHRRYYRTNNYYGGYVSFNPINGFSGTSIIGNGWNRGLQTSGGAIRLYSADYGDGAWIRLK